ncbi:MAG: hypothetical protein NXH95_05145 [Pseudomonadaceae bacterium]|nr:hypothetical protein [Pseudomonadaceae bacterium]
MRSDKAAGSNVDQDQLLEKFQDVFTDIRERSSVVGRFIDRDLYRVYIATLWSNVVLSPDEVGLEEADLELLHDILITEINDAIGPNETLHTLFKFISGKDGERAMGEARLTQSHKDLLTYFASMILDPEGHKKFMQDIRERQKH